MENGPLIYRSEKADIEYAQMIAEKTAEAIMKRIPKRDALYGVNSEEVKAAFPRLSENTLRNWCRAGKIGRLGKDKAYHVTLPEIEKYLFSK